jgi:hypothetical protein
MKKLSIEVKGCAPSFQRQPWCDQTRTFGFLRAVQHRARVGGNSIPAYLRASRRGSDRETLKRVTPWDSAR